LSDQDNIFVAHGVLIPLGNSTSQFEIRHFFFIGKDEYLADIIKCVNDTIQINEYTILLAVRPPQGQGQLINWGTLRQIPGVSCFFNPKVNHARLSEHSDQFNSWNSWMDTLITNRFFSLKGDPQLAEQRIKANLGYKFNSRSPALQYVEIKIGNNCRRINYDTYMQYTPMMIYDGKTAQLPISNPRSYDELLTCLRTISMNSFEYINLK